MLAGCSSSSLLSPRHRLRTEAAAQLQACHFQLPTSMSTQRLDLPCTTFPRKDSSSRSAGLSVDKSSSSSIELKQSIRLPPLSISRPAATIQAEVKDQFWESRGHKGLKRFAEENDENDEEWNRNRAKRKRCISENEGEGEEEEVEFNPNFWFQPAFNVPRTVQGITGIDPPQFPYQFPNNTWFMSEFTDIKDAETSNAPVGEPSGDDGDDDTSTSSGSRSIGLRAGSVVSGAAEAGNRDAVYPYNPHGGNTGVVEAEEDEDSEVERQGLELISLLNACVQAIGVKNIPVINHFIAKLGETASPRGSAISRVIAYYTEALALRVTRLWPHVFQIFPPREFNRGDDEFGTALRVLNQVTPIPKFLHFTSNETLLRSFEGKDRVHIIDFDIKQGLQWPSLFQSLASRNNPPSHVRITGVGESKQELNETGDRLAGFAGALNLPFEFHPVVDRLEDVRLWMLHVKEQESVAVNCAFQLHRTLYDTTGGALRDFLGLIRSTNPAIVLMAEQEAEHNEPRLEARVCNSLKYYAAIFDLIGSSLPLDSPARIKVEDMVAREIRNIVACEGSDRVERHEGFERWRMLMEHGGFRCNEISDREFLQSQFLLKMYECGNYNVKKQGQGNEGAAALSLSWMDQPLYTVSAWTPVDIAGGSSSSFSQPS